MFYYGKRIHFAVLECRSIRPLSPFENTKNVCFSFVQSHIPFLWSVVRYAPSDMLETQKHMLYNSKTTHFGFLACRPIRPLTNFKRKQFIV